MNLEDLKKDKMKQRSLYMDDETYGLLEAQAAKLGVSNGAALRMLLRHEWLGQPAAPVSQRPEPLNVAVLQDDTGKDIVLPPDNVETFKVPERFKEKNQPRQPRPTHVDDDF